MASKAKSLGASVAGGVVLMALEYLRHEAMYGPNAATIGGYFLLAVVGLGVLAVVFGGVLWWRSERLGRSERDERWLR